MKKVIVMAFAGIAIFAACKTAKKPAETVKTEKAPDCNGTNFSYVADIKPIMEQHCTSCHGEGGADGLNFNNKSDIVKAANKGELLGTIKWHSGFPQMPPNGVQLDKASIDKIECWISNGMK
ncbi:MAG: cytochrome c [Bacteroidia bacterium]|jgi:cytochrome c5